MGAFMIPEYDLPLNPFYSEDEGEKNSGDDTGSPFRKPEKRETKPDGPEETKPEEPEEEKEDSVRGGKIPNPEPQDRQRRRYGHKRHR